MVTLTVGKDIDLRGYSIAHIPGPFDRMLPMDQQMSGEAQILLTNPNWTVFLIRCAMNGTRFEIAATKYCAGTIIPVTYVAEFVSIYISAQTMREYCYVEGSVRIWEK